MSAAASTIWLDTDPGFDDWMAWALLEADPSVQLLGASVVAGNAPLPVVLDNALGIHALHGWRTPIYAGCDRPLMQAQVTAQDVLGSIGLRSTGRRLPPARSALHPQHGVPAMIEAVRLRPGQVTLLAIGPLTNVAMAFRQAPELPGLLKALVIMGGSLGAGNVTPVSEFNIYADPEAAQEVFDAAVKLREPLKLFGLEVCRELQATEGHVAQVRAVGSERALCFADHLDGYIELARRRGRSTSPLYDPTPVAWLAHPEWFSLEPARVDVELQGKLTRGMTVCERRVPHRAQPNALVGVAAQGVLAAQWCTDVLVQHLKAMG